MSKAKKYIKDFTNHCSNDLMFGGCAPWISPENALDAVDIEREDTLKKVCKYLEHNVLYWTKESSEQLKKAIDK